MKYTKVFSALAVVALAAACGAENEGGFDESAPLAAAPAASDAAPQSGKSPGGASSAPAANSGVAEASPSDEKPRQAPGSDEAARRAGLPADAELARIDFPDGTVVRFQELGGGVLVSELGPAETAPRFAPVDGTTLSEAFRALAPQRDIPARLADLDHVLGPDSTATPASIRGGDTRGLQKPEIQGQDVERSGQFEQSGGLYPWAQFERDACAFTPQTAFDLKHPNTSGNHSHPVPQVTRAWVAGAADIGDFTIQFCAGSVCNTQFNVAAGTRASLMFTKPPKCKSANCAWWDFVCNLGANVTVCAPARVDVVTHITGSSAGERMHDCEWYVL
jgi:hypothetical protein